MKEAKEKKPLAAKKKKKKVRAKKPATEADDDQCSDGMGESEAAPSLSTDLTAVSLNNWLVKAKQPVEQARFRLRKQLLRKAVVLEAKKGAEAQREKNATKAARLRAEAALIREPKHRQVAQAALLNVERSRESPRIGAETSPSERIFWKLALSEPVQSAVTQLRQRHPDWATAAPFFLQRLGAQYKQPQAKTKSRKTKPLPVPAKIGRKSSDGGGNLSAPPLGLVRRINLDEDFASDHDDDDADEVEKKKPKSKSKAKPPSSSFFQGGISSGDEEEEEKEERRTRRGVDKKVAGKKGQAKPGAKREAAVEEEQLHPSWAAKRAKKAAQAEAALALSLRKSPLKHRFSDSDSSS